MTSSPGQAREDEGSVPASLAGMAGEATPASARRGRAALAAVVTVAAGLSVHLALPSSVATDIAGDALYAVLIYALVVTLLPRWRPARVAVIAGTFCVAIELFQLTGLPRAWAAVFRPAALVFGSGFDARDLVVYVGAVALAASVDAALRRRSQG